MSLQLLQILKLLIKMGNMYFKTKSVNTTFDCKVSSYFCNENSSLGNFQSVNESVLKQTVSCLLYLPKHEQVIQIQQRIPNKIAMLQIYCMVNLRDINIISRSFFFNSQISKAKSFSVLRKDKAICSRFFCHFLQTDSIVFDNHYNLAIRIFRVSLSKGNGNENI